MSILQSLNLHRRLSVLPQVQSEMLKKWKRWKLGKDIDEEYRHTHSQTPHLKSGSIATGNLVSLHENNASDPGADSPRFGKANREPLCSSAPEENRRLVVSYRNGSREGRPARGSLRFSFLVPTGTAGHVSTTTADARPEEKEPPMEGEETNV